MVSAPVCFFAYNRPRHTREALSALAVAEGASETDLFIYIDGPRSNTDFDLVRDVKACAEQVTGFASVTLHVESANRGTVRSLVPAITDIVNRFGHVIVVEDDVIVSDRFLKFMNRALEHYRFAERVMSISGYMFKTEAAALLPPAFLYCKGTSIGWATWARAWRWLEMDPHQLLAQLNASGLLERLDSRGGISLSDLIRRAEAMGDEDPAASWSPRWFASIVLQNGLCLYPQQALVRNIGFDGSGLRSPISKAWDTELTSFDPTELPDDIAEHPLAEMVMSEAYRTVHAARQKGI